ncbi:MAG: hypothetical protein AAF633_09400, partial [Chloroflexota bacterium]
VILDAMRVNDIITLMENLYFDCGAVIGVEDSESTQHPYALLKARRPTGNEEMVVMIEATGSRRETERQKKIEGGTTFKSKVSAGHMTIKLKGELAGDSQLLLDELNQIHYYLKERFEHVRTIE